MRNQSIIVLVDSQAAFKALIKCTVTLIIVFNCIRNLNQLGKQNHVSTAWISGHAGVHGTEVANYVPQENSATVLNVLKTDRMEMTRQAHPSSQFEQFTID